MNINTTNMCNERNYRVPVFGKLIVDQALPTKVLKLVADNKEIGSLAHMLEKVNYDLSIYNYSYHPYNIGKSELSVALYANARDVNAKYAGLLDLIPEDKLNLIKKIKANPLFAKFKKEKKEVEDKYSSELAKRGEAYALFDEINSNIQNSQYFKDRDATKNKPFWKKLFNID